MAKSRPLRNMYQQRTIGHTLVSRIYLLLAERLRPAAESMPSSRDEGRQQQQRLYFLCSNLRCEKKNISTTARCWRLYDSTLQCRETREEKELDDDELRSHIWTTLSRALY